MHGIKTSSADEEMAGKIIKIKLEKYFINYE